MITPTVFHEIDGESLIKFYDDGFYDENMTDPELQSFESRIHIEVGDKITDDENENNFYTIQAFCGEGHFSYAFLAASHNNYNYQQYLLKVYKFNSTGHRSFAINEAAQLEMFRNQSDLTNLITFYESFEFKKHIVIVMNYAGVDLYHYMRDNRKGYATELNFIQKNDS
ncbi:hypothetical protein TRFO_19590 [Tritrichomonas foetus]|uniref:Protein kinase domain-containing protein n=1 Tax=Tritrichomonas foetus TaxID=1144522 RepID=A0A1J4KIL8_9EUKA|nr:hypothetical protein TRFO_19590 [Tritrichomonas foetus]|eukprot:OHT10914.1 hypothetical protein TRFO_19590 [Tritrichomonas foetus]